MTCQNMNHVHQIKYSHLRMIWMLIGQLNIIKLWFWLRLAVHNNHIVDSVETNDSATIDARQHMCPRDHLVDNTVHVYLLNSRWCLLQNIKADHQGVINIDHLDILIPDSKSKRQSWYFDNISSANAPNSDLVGLRCCTGQNDVTRHVTVPSHVFTYTPHVFDVLLVLGIRAVFKTCILHLANESWQTHMKH